jgi:apolipoprotein D and lipocalin family protein
MDTSFNLQKYLGLWYELGHYPGWYQPNDSYNTTALYTLALDQSMTIHNSTTINGKEYDSVGSARVMPQFGERFFRVDFPLPEVAKLTASGNFLPYAAGIPAQQPNYVIERYWVDEHETYCYAVVTDPGHTTLYLLSRTPAPSKADYDILISYITEHYDRERWVATPHYQ